MPQRILDKVNRTLGRHELLEPGGMVLVACSGGPDSLALLVLLGALEPRPPLVVAHVDHGLRPESGGDAEAVAALAASLDLPFVQRRLDLAATPPGVSENDARQARLAALESLADEVGAAHIALGHTADDQLETVLMRLCRGAGATGLAGMAPRRGRLVRPILDLTRAEVLEVLEAVGWTARQDVTNRSRRFFRNRIRHDVVPLLVKENPRLVETVARGARVLREELEALAACEAAELLRITRPDPLGPAVDVRPMASLPRGLTSRLVRRLWRRARQLATGAAEAELGERHVAQVLDLLEGATTGRCDLPGGVVALRQYDTLLFCPASRLEDPGDVCVEVHGPGRYPLPAFGMVLEAGAADVHPPPGSPSLVLALPPDAAPGWPLQVRNVLPGDRIRTGGGHRKVANLLVDRKVPRHRRRRLPLVVLEGEIVWIPDVWLKGGSAPEAADHACHLAFLVDGVAKGLD